jgi:small subunit ribosomal protein S16
MIISSVRRSGVGKWNIWTRAGYTSLPFGVSSCIIIVCLDLAGLFRNKDIRLVLMIRLSRMGARKQPHYRIVVIEKARARNGRPVEVVETYNPRTNPASIEMKRDRVDYWVSKGAQMSERVNKLYAKSPAAAPAPAA